nr:hypothetical protein [Tanacetum cinerariifolium]
TLEPSAQRMTTTSLRPGRLMPAEAIPSSKPGTGCKVGRGPRPTAMNTVRCGPASDRYGLETGQPPRRQHHRPPRPARPDDPDPVLPRAGTACAEPALRLRDADAPLLPPDLRDEPVRVTAHGWCRA